MSKDREIDDILDSVKKHKQNNDNDKSDDLLWINNDDIKRKLSSNTTSFDKDKLIPDIEPPKIYNKPQVEQNEDSKEEKGKKRFSLKAKDKKTKAEKVKKEKEITFSNIVVILVVILVIVAACVIGGVYHYQINKPEEPEFTGYDYGSDISSDYLDAYIADNSVAGSIIIEDLGIDSYVSNAKTDKMPYLYKSNDISIDQQIRSIDLTPLGVDLESLYSNSDKFIASSQKVQFNTLFEKKTYKVIGAYYTNKDPKDNNDYAFPYNINGTLTIQSLTEYRGKLESRRLYHTGYDILTTDRILNLCVDSNTIMPNYKFVVICIAADEIQKTDIVTQNESIYYPQSYYDAKGIVNPYKYAVGWFPSLVVNDKTQESIKLTQADVLQ